MIFILKSIILEIYPKIQKKYFLKKLLFVIFKNGKLIKQKRNHFKV